MALTSDLLDVAILNHLFRGISCPCPAAHFVGLYAGDPDDGGREVSGEGYERQPATFAEPGLVDGVHGVKNAGALRFKANGSWGRITHFGVFDARQNGHPLRVGRLRGAKLVEADDLLEFAAGDLLVKYRTSKGNP